MEIYTIGFAQKTAPQFFGLLRKASIKRLLDIRLNNVSQLAGFTKQTDLPFFLKEICGAEYRHELLLAPTREMLDAYKKNKGSWEDYERQFRALITGRKIEEALDPNTFQVATVLLCSEPTSQKCHRGIVAEYLRDHWTNVEVIHL